MYESNINIFQSLYGIYRAWFVSVWSTGRSRLFFLLARYPRADSSVTWPLRECFCVDKSKEYMTLKCVTVICCACYATSQGNVTFWSQISVVENSKEGINFRLKTSSCIKQWGIVELRGCTVVWCYWTPNSVWHLFIFLPQGGSPFERNFLLSSPQPEV